MTDERILILLENLEARLNDLHAEILAIRQAVLPNLDEIIAMHAGKPLATEASDET